MKDLAIIGAIVLGLSGAAVAQEATNQETNGIGAQVRELAKTNRDADKPGIGAQVRALAQAQAQANDDDADDNDDEDADKSDAALDGRLNANEDSAAALAGAVAEAGGDNRDIRDGTGAVADLRTSVRADAANARDAAVTARAAANDARLNAAAAREQAMVIRDAVRAARPGHGG